MTAAENTQANSPFYSRLHTPRHARGRRPIVDGQDGALNSVESVPAAKVTRLRSRCAVATAVPKEGRWARDSRARVNIFAHVVYASAIRPPAMRVSECGHDIRLQGMVQDRAQDSEELGDSINAHSLDKLHELLFCVVRIERVMVLLQDAALWGE
jgi:hypothetical protein